MRKVLNIIVAIFLMSCNVKSHSDVTAVPYNSKHVTTTLRDSLGKVSFSIPNRYDTFFTWTNHSDCGKPCDHEQYRFQPKSLPVYKESGFYYKMPDIPVDQFTIIHSGYFPFHDGMDTSKNFIGHNHFKEILSSNSFNGHITFDTIEKINDRYFSIVCMAGYDTTRQKYTAKVAALTTIKANEIEFQYDITSNDTINRQAFFDSSTKFIRTVRISKGI